MHAWFVSRFILLCLRMTTAGLHPVHRQTGVAGPVRCHRACIYPVPPQAPGAPAGTWWPRRHLVAYPVPPQAPGGKRRWTDIERVSCLAWHPVFVDLDEPFKALKHLVLGVDG